MSSQPKSALVLIAHGTEELEFVATYDILVRAGITTHSVFIIPDLRLPDLEKGKALQYDAIIIPGGAPGAKTISENEDVQALIAKFYADGKIVAAICAGSLAIKTSGIAKDSEVTSHPSVKGEFEKDYRYSEDRVVAQDNLITSRGPGTAILFALTLVEKLAGKEKRDEVAGPMVLSDKL